MSDRRPAYLSPSRLSLLVHVDSLAVSRYAGYPNTTSEVDLDHISLNSFSRIHSGFIADSPPPAIVACSEA
jgi:hypothetical protein